MKQKGNYVAEWFGHRVFPSVVHDERALKDQRNHRCPFLSSATRETTQCVKPKASHGVCTISSESNGPRQDWLVCPYRVLDTPLLNDTVERLFGRSENSRRVVASAPTLSQEKTRRAIVDVLREHGTTIVYFQEKLGGEISISRTDRSPELSLDCTLVELRSDGDGIELSRYGVLEIQTMDFHGSYRHAVQNLLDAQRLHDERFHEAIAASPHWLGERIEGPNIANVFKRSFYQSMLKFQLGSHPQCAGSVLALPRSVWDSWQRHLGQPELAETSEGGHELRDPSAGDWQAPTAWIYVFDLIAGQEVTPSPLVVEKRIATDSESMAYFALKVAPEAAVGDPRSIGRVLARVRQRLELWWPELWLPSLLE